MRTAQQRLPARQQEFANSSRPRSRGGDKVRSSGRFPDDNGRDHEEAIGASGGVSWGKWWKSVFQKKGSSGTVGSAAGTKNGGPPQGDNLGGAIGHVAATASTTATVRARTEKSSGTTAGKGCGDDESLSDEDDDDGVEGSDDDRQPPDAHSRHHHHSLTTKSRIDQKQHPKQHHRSAAASSVHKHESRHHAHPHRRHHQQPINSSEAAPPARRRQRHVQQDIHSTSGGQQPLPASRGSKRRPTSGKLTAEDVGGGRDASRAPVIESGGGRKVKSPSRQKRGGTARSPLSRRRRGGGGAAQGGAGQGGELLLPIARRRPSEAEGPRCPIVTNVPRIEVDVAIGTTPRHLVGGVGGFGWTSSPERRSQQQKAREFKAKDADGGCPRSAGGTAKFTGGLLDCGLSAATLAAEAGAGGKENHDLGRQLQRGGGERSSIISAGGGEGTRSAEDEFWFVP